MSKIQAVYDSNDTMKLLGKQYTGKMLGQEQFNAINDIAKARPRSFTESSAIDLYLLGYIYGQRAERAKKKAGKYNG